MNLSMINLLLIIFTFSTSSVLFGEEPPCYKDLEVNFFRPSLVNEALSMHAISQSNWNLINTELQRRVRLVPVLIKTRASKMNPNPFNTPFQAHEAAILLRQVLLEVFSETLAIFQITNQNNVEEMFQYIRERQSQRLVACFGEEEKV